MTDPRTDLVEALLHACWLVESARANVYGLWGDAFAEHFERTERRVTIVGDALLAQGVHPPAALVRGHTAWVESMVGPTPESVPLGAALLQRLAEWTNVYVVPSLGSDSQSFLALGEAELLFPVPPRMVEVEKAFIGVAPLPDGDRFVVLNDLHIGADRAEAFARRAVAEINELSPEVVLVAGDITDDGEPEQFAIVHSVLAELRCPWHAVLGNHDAVRRSTRSADGAELFEAAFGVAPAGTVVDVGGVQFALIDSTDPTPSPYPDWDLAHGGFREDAGGVPNGAFRDGQLEALTSALDPARPAVLVMHHELQPFVAFPPVQFGVRRSDSSALFDALSGHRLLGVAAGHTHRSAATTVGPDVGQLELPSVKDWPHSYAVGGVRDGRVRLVVRQIDDGDGVAQSGARLTPINMHYVLGPLAALDHTF